MVAAETTATMKAVRNPRYGPPEKLAPRAKLVLVAGGLSRKLGTTLKNRLGDKRLVTFIAKVTKDRLLALTELVEADLVVPVVDRIFPIMEAPEAIRYVETRHARGKVVITM